MSGIKPNHTFQIIKRSIFDRSSQDTPTGKSADSFYKAIEIILQTPAEDFVTYYVLDPTGRANTVNMETGRHYPFDWRDATAA